jgi:dTDP-glucose 4,6-dehydratase
MKLLVTGGAGFMGANFIKYWLDNHPDDKIVNYDKLTYAANEEILKEFDTYPNYRLVHHEILHEHVLYLESEGIDTIVHFAAETHVDRSIKNDEDFLYTNVLGTRNLLILAKQRKVKRFHHISTDEVFGSLKLADTRKFSDYSKYDPRSPYAASKAAADHWVRAYYHTYGIPVTISNSSNNFGPYQFPEKFIPIVITNALEDKPIPVYGKGINVRDWLYVDDHTKAVEAVLLKGEVGETYYISSHNDYNNITVAEMILEIMGKPKSLLKFVKDRPGHDLRYALSDEKIKKLGWKPKNSFTEDLKKTIEWYKNNIDWWKTIKNSENFREYYNKNYGGQV